MNRKPLSIAQLKASLMIRREKAQSSATAFKGHNGHPQVQPLYEKAVTEVALLDDILQAIEQRTLYFLEH